MFRIKIIFITYISVCVNSLNAVLYDCYSGKPANKTQLKIYAMKNNTGICTVDVKPCDPEEWRRIDGSCNNLNYPSRGTYRTPTIRLLTPDFSPNYEPRKAANGDYLPLARRLRTEILQVGKASDLEVTQLVTHFMLLTLGDINFVHDVRSYVAETTYCCKPEGKKDYMCTPNKIPIDDPVHRYSGIRCMNLTRPQSFQTHGCLENGTTYSRTVFQTPVFDLSNTYLLSTDRLRTYKNGLLKIEEDNGLLFPPSDPISAKKCALNQLPRETRCHMYHLNNIIGPNLLTVLFYSQHNQIAEELHQLNPLWDDERLFYTARDINIAVYSQINLYELLPVLLGKESMISEGILSYDGGFRDLYNENVPPQLTDEYVFVQRWLHTIQDTDLELYDKDGFFVKTVPLVNCTARIGFLATDDNMLKIIQGSFRQPSAKSDYTIDYDMAERILGGILLSSDVATSDLAKGRYFGMQPYIKYKEFCTKKSYKCFSDLEPVFGLERTHRLKKFYKNVNDIDLMAGLWAEILIKGGRVPETMHCLMVEQLKRTIASDRHWYERPNRPHANACGLLAQLKAIRNVTVAGMLCTVGNFVTEIQPNAFYTISSKNPLTKCYSPKIGKLNLAPWKDSQEKTEA